MVLVRLRQEGLGIYRYEWPDRAVGRLRLNLETGWPERLKSMDLGLDPDPYITAALAIKEHWRKYRELPDLLEVVRPACSPDPPRAATSVPAPKRQGRLREVSGRPMPVAEIAKRNRG